MTTPHRIALATALLVLFLSPAARAEDYGVFIDIETEEDLLDLKTSGEITDSTYETLRELLRDGVDLNRASRSTLYTLPNLSYDEVDAILLYRKETGFIGDAADLVKAGIVSAKKLVAIAPFLVVSKRKVRLKDVKGSLRYGISYLGAQAPGGVGVAERAAGGYGDAMARGHGAEGGV